MADKDQGNQPGSSRPQPGEGENRMGGSRLWGVLLWLFLAWIAVSFFTNAFDDRGQAEIAYTTFKQQVAAGNVREVTISGQRIEGRFAQPYQPAADHAAGQSRADTTSRLLFATVRPAFEDPKLLALLEDNGVVVSAKAGDSSSWLYYLAILALPWLLLIGYFAYAGRKMRGSMRGMMSGRGGGGLFGVGKSKARRYEQTGVRVTFDDVAGQENAKQALMDIIDYLRNPDKFKALGADIPKGVLLTGPPGVGKTLLAKATAGEAHVPFYSISGSEFIEMFVGVGASRVRDMFDQAKREQPSIIFIDELDSIGRARGTGLGGGHDEREQTLNQILSEMDGFDPHESVVVLAATNRPDVLDPALTRPGRFDRQVVLNLPHREARKEILKIHLRDVPLGEGIDLDNLAARTVGFSGADLENLVNEAALLAGRHDKTRVEREDFEQARDTILLGALREEKLDEDQKRVIAYHEAGHAMMARLLPETDPLEKVTIIPRGQALGVTMQVPEEDRYNLNRRYLLDRVTVMLGGRAAEKVVFDELTSGAADDIKQATRLVRRMVCQWGMSERIGPVYFPLGEEHVFLGREMAQTRTFSEHTNRLIDEEIKQIISELEAKAIEILSQHRQDLEVLAANLIERETLSKREIEELLGPAGRRQGKPERQGAHQG